MDLTRPGIRARAEQDLAHTEAKMNRIVWTGRLVGAVLAGALLVFLLLTAAEQPWQYLAYPLAIGLLLGYAIGIARYIRVMHVEVLRRYQAQLVIRSAELQEMASRDELTGLYNRRHFYEAIQTEVERARASREPLALLLLDVDGLKGINDEYGHQVGDVIIANFARVIAKYTRNGDVPARLGGDEFGVIMPDTDKRGAFALAQRLWADLEEKPMYERDGKIVMVNVSIGVSGFPWGGEDVDEMMHWADADMYANKISRRLPPQPVSAEGPGDLNSLPDDYTSGG